MHLSEDLYVHLFEFAVQVELPPVKVVGEEGVIICAAVTGVGQDVAATLGEAEEDVSRRKINSSLMMEILLTNLHFSSIPNSRIQQVVACLLDETGEE